MKWDFIVVHEAGHEWWGNNITTKDLADMWVHESFGNYSESLFVETMYGKQAANEYNAGIRRGIRNDTPIIPRYDVNEEGSGDMYPKGGNMLHAIRHSMADDEKFRQILRGLNQEFYHQTVTTKQIEDYISKNAGYDYSKVFDQYLRTIDVPKLEYYFNADRTAITYRWTNCVKGFNLPLALSDNTDKVRILPTDEWKTTPVKDSESKLITPDGIKKMYYVEVAEVRKS
jgi:aminopeptidase N